MVINGFTLANPEKVDRAVNGSIGQEGQLYGGVGDQDEAAILAAYDKLGGLILKGKNKVRNGSFYDFEKKAPRVKPQVTLIFHDMDGNTVELKDGEEIPDEIKAGEILHKKRAEKSAKASAEAAEKAKVAKSKKKAVAEEEDGEADEE